MDLVLQIFAQLSRCEVPHFDEPVHGPSDQILAVWAELGRLRVTFGAKFEGSRECCRMPLILLLADRRFSTEQINLGA